MSKSINACADVKMIRIPDAFANWQAAEVITDKMQTNSESAFLKKDIIYLSKISVQNIPAQRFYVIVDYNNNTYLGLLTRVKYGKLVLKYLNRAYGALSQVISPDRIKDLYLVFESSRSRA